METKRRSTDAGDSGTDASESAVTVHRTCGDRVVFTETDNTDAWIATDAAVEITQ